MSERVHRPFDTMRTTVARICEQLFPGIGRYDRPIYARVKGVQQLAGQVTSARKLWSCTVEPLTLDLNPDPTRPIIKDVPIDPIQIGIAGTALFAKPIVGMVIRLAWMGGNRAHPFILSFTAEDQTLPATQTGELSDLLYQAVLLLSKPRQTAVGPGPYDPNTQIDLLALLMRIPR